MNVLSDEIQDSISKLSSLALKVPTRIGMIKTELVLCEQEKLDIEHKIEKVNSNAYQGWQQYRDLQITLRKRRELKDELKTLEGLSERMSKRDILISHASGISQSIASRGEYNKARTYSVRIRKDLVDNKKGIVLR